MNEGAPDNSDQRRFTRVPFDAKVLLTFDSSNDELQVYGILTDISFKGLMVALDQANELKLGMEGRATVQLSSGQVSFQLEIVVKHIEEQSLGLEVIQMPIEAAEHLRALMQHNLGDEGLLKRELHALITP